MCLSNTLFDCACMRCRLEGRIYKPMNKAFFYSAVTREACHGDRGITINPCHSCIAIFKDPLLEVFHRHRDTQEGRIWNGLRGGLSKNN